MKLIILSDTHGLLRPQVLEHLQGADAILHAGDINTQSVVDELSRYAPLYVVRGNNDHSWAKAIPHHLTAALGGVNFYMVHNKRDVPPELEGADVVVYGHSHKYAQEEKNGVLWLNPGSCGPRRFHQEITLAAMEIEDGEYRVEKIVIPNEGKTESRIRRMEKLLNQSTAAVDNLDRALEDYRAAQEGIEELRRYYEGGQWMEDFTADQEGKLPKDLPRGVLTEDAIYDLLTDQDRLKGIFRELAGE